jgi:hypothetical protein
MNEVGQYLLPPVKQCPAKGFDLVPGAVCHGIHESGKRGLRLGVTPTSVETVQSFLAKIKIPQLRMTIESFRALPEARRWSSLQRFRRPVCSGCD